ncbi:hypothetical protein Droror1_Dr00001753 [Drosera rotundifolia]
MDWIWFREAERRCGKGWCEERGELEDINNAQVKPRQLNRGEKERPGLAIIANEQNQIELLLKEDSAGFLNFDRVMNLNSLEADLSATLVGPPRAATVQQPVNTQPVERATRQWKPAPTRREQDRWNRATRAASE